jgi:hypothetical protein
LSPTPFSREQIRASIERAGDDNWRALVAHHEDAYPASRPTPGDVARAEAERLNELGLADRAGLELVDTRVERVGESEVRLTHRFRLTPPGVVLSLEPYTNYS